MHKPQSSLSCSGFYSPRANSDDAKFSTEGLKTSLRLKQAAKRRKLRDVVNKGCKQDEEIKRGEISRKSSSILYHPEPTIAMQNSPLRAFEGRLSEQSRRRNSEADQGREPEGKTKGTAEGHHQSV